MSKIRLLTAVLNLFDGGAGGAAGGASGGADGAGATGAEIPSSAAGKKAGEYANVIFGKQTDAQPDGTNNTEAESGDAGQKAPEKVPFKDLINGEYKTDFDNIFNKRFKDYKDLQKKVSDQGQIVDMLMAKYNIENGDLASLTQAIENDDEMWAAAADDAGLSVDQYKALQKLQRQNQQLMRAQQAQEEARQAQAREQKLMADAQAVKEVFPDFDLATEIGNTVDPETGRSRFVELLSAGIDMETAYKTIHFNELMNGAMQQTARQTEKKLTDNIRAKGSRPQENGTTSQSAFTVKADPKAWTRKDRAEVIRRVARGEKITL